MTATSCFTMLKIQNPAFPTVGTMLYDEQGKARYQN
jgi:hypothetical protein